jgi:hypothetical protein
LAPDRYALPIPSRCVAAGALSSDAQVPKEAAERSLSKLCQFGTITVRTIEPLLEALEPSPQNRADRELCRLLYYLVQLSLGDGFAGTPMPVPRNHNREYPEITPPLHTLRACIIKRIDWSVAGL